MFKQGIVLHNFLEKTKPYWSTEYKNCVIVGHVLDRDEAWWQIHPQTKREQVKVRQSLFFSQNLQVMLCYIIKK